MITRVHIKNYRSLGNVEVSLGSLTVLVGRNGAGKSNFVDAIQFVQEALQVGLEAAVANRNGLAALRRWTGKGRPYEIEIEVEIKQRSLHGTYLFVLASGQNSDFRIKREFCQVVRTGRQASTDSYEIREGAWIKQPSELENPDIQKGSTSARGRQAKQLNLSALFLPSMRVWIDSPFSDMFRTLTVNSYFSIYPNTMRGPQRFSSARLMGSHGENFSSALRSLRQRWETNQRAEFPDLLAALRRVVDDVSDVQVRPVSGYLVTELKHDYQRNGGGEGKAETSPWFDLSQESDGTLRMLGLLVGLYEPGINRGLVAVEEPEVNIHPGALAVLVDVLREVSERRQVLLTTQSPDLISRFPVDDLRIVERIKGSTHIGRIADAQREAIEKQLFTTGDLMRIEGLYSSQGANAEYA